MKNIQETNKLPINYIYQYRNEQKELLYIGVAQDPKKRYQQHKKYQHWFSEVKYIEYAVFSGPRSIVNAIEVSLIEEFNPPHNKTYRTTHFDKADSSKITFYTYERDQFITVGHKNHTPQSAESIMVYYKAKESIKASDIEVNVPVEMKESGSTMFKKYYKTGEVSEITEIQPDLLRKYCRFFEIEVETGTQGHRIFTQENIDDLQEIKEQIKSGFSWKSILAARKNGTVIIQTKESGDENKTQDLKEKLDKMIEEIRFLQEIQAKNEALRIKNNKLLNQLKEQTPQEEPSFCQRLKKLFKR